MDETEQQDEGERTTADPAAAAGITFEDHRWYTIVRLNGEFLRAFCGGSGFSGLGAYDAGEQEEFEKWRRGDGRHG
jgi:hypothetical protein